MKRYLALLISVLAFSQLCYSADLFGINISKNRQETISSLEKMGFEQAKVTGADGTLVPNETDNSAQFIGSLFNRLATVDVLYGEDPSTIKMVKFSFKYFNNATEMLTNRQTALDNIEQTHGTPTYHFSKTAMTADDTDIMLGRFGTAEKVPTLYDLWIMPESFIELVASPDNSEFYATYLLQN